MAAAGMQTRIVFGDCQSGYSVGDAVVVAGDVAAVWASFDIGSVADDEVAVWFE